MGIGNGICRGAGDFWGKEFATGRLLSTAALVGMDVLTAPETTTLRAGRFVVADMLNTRTEATAANRFDVGNEGCDYGNFLLPGVAGQGDAPFRFGGVLTAPTAIGAPCRIQVAGIAELLVSATVAVGQVIIICDGPAAARNARGTGIGLTPNTTTGAIVAPTAGVAVGTTANNTYPIVGEVLRSPDTNGTVAAPQIALVRLFGMPQISRIVTSN